MENLIDYQQYNFITESDMKTYQEDGYEYFYDRNIRQWTLYPIDGKGNRIEWNKDDLPIESEYFNKKSEVKTYIAHNKNKHPSLDNQNL